MNHKDIEHRIEIHQMAFIYNGYNKYFRDLVFIYCGVFAQPCVQRMPTTYGVDLVNMEILKQ